MNVGVACADHHSVVAVEQQVTVERVGACLHGKEHAEKYRAVRNRCRRYRPSLGRVFDVVMNPIGQSGQQRAREQREQCPVLQGDIGGQREQIEANVVVEKRIVRAIGHVVEELQNDAPVADFVPGDNQSEEPGAARDSERPWQPIAHEFEEIGRHRGGCGLQAKAGGNPPPSGKAECEPCVGPHNDGSCCEDHKKHCGFRGDRRPENLRITDCGEPHPVDQEVADEPEKDQANCCDDGSNDQPYHGVSPWYLRFGSGNPDRHRKTIAETSCVIAFVLGPRTCFFRTGLPTSRTEARIRPRVPIREHAIGSDLRRPHACAPFSKERHASNVSCRGLPSCAW